MVIDARLSRRQFIRLAILRHLQRPGFYLFAGICAFLSAYALLQGVPLVLLAGWAPFLLYIALGVLGALRAGRNPRNPSLAQTRYAFTDEGIAVRALRQESHIPWAQVWSWRVLLNCYVVTLAGGFILVIPQEAVPPHQRAAFEALLRERIGKRPLAKSEG